VDDVKDGMTDGQYLDMCNGLFEVHKTIKSLEKNALISQLTISHMQARNQDLTNQLLMANNEITKFKDRAAAVKVTCECGLQISKSQLNRHIAGSLHRRRHMQLTSTSS